MAILHPPLTLREIDKNWYVSYYFMTQAWYDYKVTLKDKSTGQIYKIWDKLYVESGHPERTADTFQYKGEKGNLICTVDCPKSDLLKYSGPNVSDITANMGEITLGKTYTIVLDDGGGGEENLDFNDLFICVIGWTKYG